MKEQIVYKLVDSVTGSFLSMAYGSSWPLVPLEYRIGYKTVPRFGKIFVFDSIEHARSSYGSYTLLKGVGVNPTKLKLVPDYHNDAVKFWDLKKKKKGLGEMDVSVPFKGTLVVDSFTPTEVIRYQ
jgi:hypothetical protein